MLILGIDPGTGRTGWGVIEQKKENRVVYVAHGCIETSQEQQMHDRLHTLYENLRTIIKNHKPECVVVEQIFFGLNARTAISVSQARGISMLIASQSKLPFFEYTPLAVKHLLSGSGKTEKNEMKRVVRSLLSKNNRTLSFSAKDKGFDDAADALAIAIHHAWKASGNDKVILAARELVKVKNKKK